MTNRLKTIYISGPIAALDDEGKTPSLELMKQRKNKFAEVAAVSAEHHGGRVNIINPVEVPACTPERSFCDAEYAVSNQHSWQCYMRHDVRELCLADEIVMLDGWEKSPGATAEFRVAEMLMIPAMFWDDKKNMASTFPSNDAALDYVMGTHR